MKLAVLGIDIIGDILSFSVLKVFLEIILEFIHLDILGANLLHEVVECRIAS